MFALAMGRAALPQQWVERSANRLDGRKPSFVFRAREGAAWIKGRRVPIGSALSFASGSKMVIGFDGTIKTVSANSPAFGYSNGRRRLLVEAKSATNHILSNDGTGAVAGTPGTLPTGWSYFSTSGLSSQVVGKGTALGIPYVDLRLFGTATSTSVVLALGAKSGVAAGDRLCTSAWLSLVGGSTAGIVATYVETRWPSGANTDAAVALTATPTRVYAAGTNGSTAGTVYPALYLNLTNGAAINITIRIGLPQLEAGLVPTSPIVTSGSAATRITDDVRLSASALAIANTSGGSTIALRCRLTGADSYARILGDPTADSSVMIREAANDGIGIYSSAGSAWIYGGASLFSDFGACAAYSPASKKISKAGLSSPSSATAFPTLGGLRIFGGYFTSNANGYLDELVIWPFVGSDAGIQAQARIAA